MPDIEIDLTTKVFFLAQSAHEQMGYVKELVAAYQRKAKATDLIGIILDAANYKTLLADLRGAKAGLDKALENWERIVDIIASNPDMQA